MRFILTSTGLAPTDGAIIPEIIKQATEPASFGQDVVLALLTKICGWLAHIGMPVLSEALLVWSLFCFLMAITGKGGWMERGVKSLIGFALVGVASHAV